MLIVLGGIVGICLYLGDVNIGIPIYYIELLFVIIFLINILKFSICIDKYLIVLFMLLIVNFCALLYTDNLYNVLQGVKTYVFLILIYISLRQILHNRDMQKIQVFVGGILSTFFYLTVINILFIVVKNNLFFVSTIYQYKEFFVVPFGASNYIASFLALFLLMYFVDMIENKSKISVFNFCLSIMAIFILNSRSAIIAVIIGIVAYLLFNIKKIKWRSILLISVIAFGVFLFLNSTPFMQLIVDRFINESNNVDSRINQYTDVISEIKNSSLKELVFGRGMGSDKVMYGLVIHNVFLRLIYSIGIIGTIIYIMYYIFLLKDLIFLLKYNTLYKKYLYGLLSFIVSSLAEPVLYISFTEYFLVILIAVVVREKIQIGSKVVIRSNNNINIDTKKIGINV